LLLGHKKLLALPAATHLPNANEVNLVVTATRRRERAVKGDLIASGSTLSIVESPPSLRTQYVAAAKASETSAASAVLGSIASASSITITPNNSISQLSRVLVLFPNNIHPLLAIRNGSHAGQSGQPMGAGL
jgi:hypothetical protein